MGWFDKLKALLNIEVNSPLVSVNVTKNSDNKVTEKESFYDDEGKKLYINYDKLTEQKKKELSQILKDKVESGGEILEKDTSTLLQKLKEYQKNKGDDKKILDFFSAIIPTEDLEALESALYIRKIFSEGKEVSKLKVDLRIRFGDRGKNIANLCTAGYFEKFLMPLYNSSKEDFERIYEVVISKSAMAIFVHSQMISDEITKELKGKITLSKNYGLDFIHIHGIGETNIRIIKRWIAENKEFFSFFEKEIFEDRAKGIIIVELLL